MNSPPDVRAGQVWADNDPRAAGRTFRVERVKNGKAACVVLTNSTEADSDLRNGHLQRTDTRSRKTTLSLTRFRPTRTGYRLIRDSQYGIRWPTGSVFSYPSREAAETTLRADSRDVGVLVVREYDTTSGDCTEWQAVEADPPSRQAINSEGSAAVH